MTRFRDRSAAAEVQIEAEVAEELMIDNAIALNPCAKCAYFGPLKDMHFAIRDALVRTYPNYTNAAGFCKNPITADYIIDPEQFNALKSPVTIRHKPIYQPEGETCYHFVKRFVSVIKDQQ